MRHATTLSILFTLSIVPACLEPTTFPAAPGDHGTTGASTAPPQPDPTTDEGSDEGSTIGDSTENPVEETSTSGTAGGASSDTGSNDDGSGETGTGDLGEGALDCESEGVWVCETFEDGESDLNLEPYTTQGATVLAETGLVHRGEKALHVHLPAIEGARGTIRVAPGSGVLPPADNQIFGRVFLYAGQAAVESSATVISAAGPVEGVSDSVQYRFNCNASECHSRYWHTEIGDHAGYQKPGFVLPAETWVCVEWHYDGVNNEMRYWFDGTIDDAMTVLSTEDPPWIAPTFNAFFVGWHGHHVQGQEVDVWLDDLMLASERIGCGA